ncbi:MAG: glycosyltransferase family 2 protein [Candidatus Bathyarchaeota archaeon]|nr:glycosyltransferase family 2 protein [Candidatus Bathyarchaeota archaeon]
MSKRKQSGNSADVAVLPTFSVIVPAKNEGKVIGRLLSSLSKINYPTDKYEVIIVEDGSRDNTLDICKQFVLSNKNFQLYQRSSSTGKPSALNYGMRHASGELIAVFDADNVPACDVLIKAAKYFDVSNVAAVQGRTMSINSKENMLTQFISYEEAVWCEAYLRGKDTLGLFVHLKGSCQFIRRDVLEKLSGFDENILSEDMEFSAKLAENKYAIRYAGDVLSWQESPSKLKTLFSQRTRWFRGTMDVAVKYGKLMTKPSWRNFDAEVTLVGPFILMVSLLSYLMTCGLFFNEAPYNILWSGLSAFSMIATSILILLCGTALIYVTKPMRLKNLLWLPFVFGYWMIQSFIAFYAGMQSLLRRPANWLKTEKSGTVNDPAFPKKVEVELK